MAIVTINGTVKLVGQTQQISERFSKRELVITETAGQYPQHIPIEFANDKTALLDSVAPGEQVTVTCYVNGREYTDRNGAPRHFLSLRGDRIEKATGATTAPPGPSAATASVPVPPPPGIADMPADSGEDDLPF